MPKPPIERESPVRLGTQATTPTMKSKLKMNSPTLLLVVGVAEEQASSNDCKRTTLTERNSGGRSHARGIDFTQCLLAGNSQPRERGRGKHERFACKNYSGGVKRVDGRIKKVGIVMHLSLQPSSSLAHLPYSFASQMACSCSNADGKLGIRPSVSTASIGSAVPQMKSKGERRGRFPVESTDSTMKWGTGIRMGKITSTIQPRAFPPFPAVQIPVCSLQPDPQDHSTAE